MLRYVISWVLKVEGILLFLPALTGAIYRERQGLAYVLCGLLCIGVGFLLCWRKPENMEIYPRDGFVAVALSWVVLSVFGCLPFMVTGEIPSFIDALFVVG